jgi:hypothetical protein
VQNYKEKQKTKRRKDENLQKDVKKNAPVANSSLFTLHFSLFFVPLHPLLRDCA